MEKNSAVFCVVILFFGLAIQVCGDELPAVAPIKFDKAPKIDGVLNDTAWKKVPEAGPLFDISDSTRILKKRTTFKVGYNKEALYLGITCYDNEMKSLKASDRIHDDGSIFSEDSIEIFIDPARREKEYFQFVCNASGSTWDAKNTFNQEKKPIIGSKWNGKWQAAVCHLNDRWIVEMAIPFTTLGLKPELGKKWGLGVNRNIKGKPDFYAMWSPCQRGFQYVKGFGNLWFGKEKEILKRIQARLEDIKAEISVIQQKLQEVLKGEVSGHKEFKQRFEKLFRPFLQACKEDSSYLILGDAQIAYLKIQENWEELYYDIKFAILIGE